NDGLGPWQDEEMQAALQYAVREGRSVIPVVLPGAAAKPELPLFLSNRTWVDFREGFTSPLLDKLVWGITGIKATSVKPDESPKAIRANAAQVCDEKLAYLQEQRDNASVDVDLDTLERRIQELRQRVAEHQSPTVALPDNSNRSISIGGNLTGGAVVLGNNNVISLKFTQTTLPSPSSVEIKLELEALRSLLQNLRSDNAKKIDRAIEDAQDEASRPEPDHDEIGSAIERALKYAEQASGYADQLSELQGHVTKITAWLGSHWNKLLTIVGLTT
ncbi:MAG: hypothetical protein AAFX06_09330, partial [Planctomycetota bacterium]